MINKMNKESVIFIQRRREKEKVKIVTALWYKRISANETDT